MSTRTVRFALLCEGSSDGALVPHLEKLLLHYGATEATGTPVPLSSLSLSEAESVSSLGGKISEFLSTDSGHDLLFVHRDADRAGHAARLQEIRTGIAEADPNARWVPVIPVRATEAWILLDEAEIRKVAGNPNGKAVLDLPRPSQVEQVADPKSMLEDVLCQASEHAGRRLRRFKSNFPKHRSILLQQLPIGGPLEQVAGWSRLRDAVTAFLV